MANSKNGKATPSSPERHVKVRSIDFSKRKEEPISQPRESIAGEQLTTSSFEDLWPKSGEFAKNAPKPELTYMASPRRHEMKNPSPTEKRKRFRPYDDDLEMACGRFEEGQKGKGVKKPSEPTAIIPQMKIIPSNFSKITVKNDRKTRNRWMKRVYVHHFTYFGCCSLTAIIMNMYLNSKFN